MSYPISVRVLLSFGLCALALIALPAAAGATTYCAPSPCSPGTQEATIADAVTAADTNAGPDTVSITAGTHNVGTGISVNQPDTAIHGAGIGQTIITGDPFPHSDPGTNRILFSGYMSKLSDLTLRLPSAVTSGNSTSEGADVYDGVVENVRIDALGATFGSGDNDGNGAAALIRSGTVRHLTVDFPANADASGLRLGGSASTVDLSDVTINSPQPFYSDPETSAGAHGYVTAKRMQVTSTDPVTLADGFLSISDSVIDNSSAPRSVMGYPEYFPTAVAAFDGRAPDPAGLTLDRVTLIGNGGANATAMGVAGQGGTPVTYLHARHVVADGFGRTLAYQNYGSNPTATINFSAVPLGAGTIVNSGPNPSTLGGNQTGGNRGGDPNLLPNLSLPLNSPAVDIGGADLIPRGPTDLAGNPRLADGNGDGIVREDAGAYERVYTPDGATLKIKGKKVKLNKKGKGAVRLTCPAADAQPGPCTAKLKLTTRKAFKLGHSHKGGKHKRHAGELAAKQGKHEITLAKSKPTTIPAGETKPAKLKVKGAQAQAPGGEQEGPQGARHRQGQRRQRGERPVTKKMAVKLAH